MMGVDQTVTIVNEIPEIKGGFKGGDNMINENTQIVGLSSTAAENIPSQPTNDGGT